MCADHFCAFGFLGEKFVHFGHRAIVGDDGEAMIVHVEN